MSCLNTDGQQFFRVNFTHSNARRKFTGSSRIVSTCPQNASRRSHSFALGSRRCAPTFEHRKVTGRLHRTHQYLRLDRLLNAVLSHENCQPVHQDLLVLSTNRCSIWGRIETEDSVIVPVSIFACQSNSVANSVNSCWGSPDLRRARSSTALAAEGR